MLHLPCCDPPVRRMRLAALWNHRSCLSNARRESPYLYWLTPESLATVTAVTPVPSQARRTAPVRKKVLAASLSYIPVPFIRIEHQIRNPGLHPTSSTSYSARSRTSSRPHCTEVDRTLRRNTRPQAACNQSSDEADPPGHRPRRWRMTVASTRTMRPRCPRACQPGRHDTRSSDVCALATAPTRV